MSRLVVLIGPIGAGKSTVAAALVDRLAAAGRTAAVIDVDDVVRMQRAPRDQVAHTWARGHQVHGAVVGAWLRSGVNVVIAHGPAFTAEETDALMAFVPPGTSTLRSCCCAATMWPSPG